MMLEGIFQFLALDVKQLNVTCSSSNRALESVYSTWYIKFSGPANAIMFLALARCPAFYKEMEIGRKNSSFRVYFLFLIVLYVILVLFCFSPNQLDSPIINNNNNILNSWITLISSTYDSD